jgi:HD-GYP domain-containing protein (c-di-GMP phosphodiesterase class II)
MREGHHMLSNPTSNNQYIKKLIKDLQPGDIILHPLYRSDGLLLIDKNRTLNESLIKIVQKHILPTATILVAASEDEFNNFSQKNNENNKEFITDLEFLVKEYQSNTGQYFDYNSISKDLAASSSPFVKQLLSCPYWIILESRFESEQVKRRCQHVKHEFIDLLSNNIIFDKYYTIIKSYDDVLLIHSLNNVCTSLMIGLTLEMQIEDLIDLAISALFMNVGFTSLPKEDFKSFLKTQIYNTSVMKKHIEIFTDVTMDAPFLRKKSIIQGILDHHEYYNGKGYPNKKTGEEISLFGRILHIVHSYDSMVGGYNYTTGILPMEAFHIIFDNKENRFDPYIIQIFIHRTRYFKLGETIHLPLGVKGKIVDFYDYMKHPDRPIVELTDGSKVDLLTMSDQ